MKLGRFMEKGARRGGELCPFPYPTEETDGEKNLREIDIIESSKKELSENVYLYQTRDGNAGVFKSGDRNYKLERAAYEVDKFFEFDIVPVTVIRTIGGKEGSFQRFISNVKSYREVSNDAVPREEKVKAVMFDFLINVVDRVTGSFLVEEKQKRVFANDNECSYSTNHFYNRPIYFGENLFSTPIPEKIRNKIFQFDKWPDGKNFLAKSLKKYLENKEVDAFFKRLYYLTQYAKRGYFQTEGEYEKLKEQYEKKGFYTKEEREIREIERKMNYN